MKTVKWNKEQLRAIEERNCNILVSAGAGSGKTAVLTERIVSLIEEGNSILDFAICTFTEDATLEMKNRIREKLLEKGMQEQADLVYMSDISTIHSLCKKIIMDNFDVIGLPPKFTVLSNEAVMIEQAMTRALNSLFEDEMFTAFAMKFAPADDVRIKELLLFAYKFCRDIPNYKGFLQHQADMYKNKDYSVIEREYCRIKSYALKNVLTAYDRLMEETLLEEKELNTVIGDRALLNGIMENMQKGSLDLGEVKFATMPRGAAHKEEINQVRKEAKALVKDILGYRAILNCDEIMEDAGEDLQMLLKGIATLEDEYSAIKKEKGYLTFNDLERYAYEILQNSKAALEYKKRYKYIFVDEYQDTSRLQQSILDSLKGEKNMFMVGDIKQSIYGFRNADPSMFHKVYQEYEDEGENVKIDLFRNYRSSANILNCVNDVFSLLLNLSENYYPKGAFLVTDVNCDDTPVEIDLIDKESSDGAEAKRIAQRIKECVAKGYEYRDIAVLFRSVKGSVAGELHSLLKQEGIPADMSKSEDNLYMETRVFIDLISIIDNTDNDIPLISVMFSDIGGFTVDDLIEIKKGKRDSFYSCLKSYNGNEDLKTKINEFLSMLDDFAIRGRDMSVDELMAAVLMHTGYLKQVEKHKDSKAKISQIYHLMKSAKEFEHMGYYGISGFLEYFEALKELKKAPDMEGFVQGSNAVSIMTMHKSKGLEFPVVIIGDTNKRLYHNTQTGYYVFNNRLGIGLSHIDTQRRAKIQTPMMALIKEQNTINTLEEQMRMLYVAMTRAKERMYITGVISDDEMDKLSETKTVNMEDLTSGNTTFLKALLSAVYASRAGGKGKYSINRVHIEDKDEEIKKTVVVPEHSQKVTDLLNEAWDTSTVTVPRKASVTGLTKDENAFVPYKSMGRKKSKDGALAGTVTHALLYHLRQSESFDMLIERMKHGEYFSEKELTLIDRDMIEQFKSSGLYKRICKSQKVYREKPFILELGPQNGYCDEPVMVQGIIDCVFEEGGSFVLVDYKTDNIVKNAKEILKQKYQKQLELYALAINRITGKQVKEKIIYHLKTGKEIEL